jgi:hypothetical protein
VGRAFTIPSGIVKPGSALARITARPREPIAITKWQLGEVGPARALIEDRRPRDRNRYVPTLVHTYVNKAHFEIVRGDAGAAGRTGSMDDRLSANQ